MKEILEYKMDANDAGNFIVPNWVDKSDCGYFYNPANYTYIGIRLNVQVKVPESVTKLTQLQLTDRCKIPGVMMKLEGEGEEAELVQMTDQEIEAIVEQFCLDRGITE